MKETLNGIREWMNAPFGTRVLKTNELFVLIIGLSFGIPLSVGAIALIFSLFL